MDIIIPPFYPTHPSTTNKPYPFVGIVGATGPTGAAGTNATGIPTYNVPANAISLTSSTTILLQSTGQFSVASNPVNFGDTQVIQSGDTSPVTINSISGQIVLSGDGTNVPSGTGISFTVNNSCVTSSSVIILSQINTNSANWCLTASSVTNGSFILWLQNNGANDVLTDGAFIGFLIC